MTGRKLLPGRPLKPSEITDYLIDRGDSSEIFSPAFLRRLNALNSLVGESGEPLEGGVFYWDQEPDYQGRPPAASLAPARRNLWRATRFKARMIEIGVNAGHSALLALSANPDLIYYGVDIDLHRYTAACVAFLAREFPGRVHYFPGDSREVLPWIATHRAELDFDIFHVDGGHTTEICRADVSNCLRLAGGGAGKHLLLDDINASWIFDVYAEFVSRGRLATETFFGDWEDDNRNVLARIL
ncbi:MAG: class I SAM-dependent methyltransferase [Roseiarcus sp.]|jgi:methyltransferase family protein